MIEEAPTEDIDEAPEILDIFSLEIWVSNYFFCL